MLLTELFSPLKALNESIAQPVYHSYRSDKLWFAIKALEDNELMGTSTQRWWEDGRRRKENWENYEDSYWMKGISLTRDLNYAKDWGPVIFILDRNKIAQRHKVVPFAWNYHFSDDQNPPNSFQPNHKREREEYVVVTANKDRYVHDRAEDDEDYDEYWQGQLDQKRFVEPEGSIKNLNNILMGILIDKKSYELHKENNYLMDELNYFIEHPKFKGFV